MGLLYLGNLQCDSPLQQRACDPQLAEPLTNVPNFLKMGLIILIYLAHRFAAPIENFFVS
jgi:hypothetical protein